MLSQIAAARGGGNVMVSLIIAFAGGWAAGLIGEWAYHRYMHHKPLMFHIQHHKEFFHLAPSAVARMARCLLTSFRYAGMVLIALSPLMLLFGVAPVVAFFIGAVWHLIFVYEVCHSVIHDDCWVPNWLRR